MVTGSEAADGMCLNNKESNIQLILHYNISLFEHLELLELRATSTAGKTMLFCVVSLESRKNVVLSYSANYLA